MRILIVDQNPEDACSWYRCSGPWGAIARTRKVDVVFNDQPNWRDLRGFDCVFVLRPHLETDLKIIREAMWHGVKVWTDFDDNLFAIPPENPARLLLGNAKSQAIMQQAIELSDVVTVSTEALKKAFSELIPAQKNYRVVQNALDESFLRSRKEIPPAPGKVVLWRGSSTHLADLETYRREIVELARTFPTALWLFMGTEPWFSGEINSRVMPPQPIFNYFNHISHIRSHIGIVPLQNTDFNHSKSDIAALELSFTGAKCLVPSFWQSIPGTVKYTGTVEFGEKLFEMLRCEETENDTLEYFKTHRSLKKANELRIEILGDIT